MFEGRPVTYAHNASAGVATPGDPDLVHIPLPPPRRRGKHARPSKTAHAIPAVLLALPVTCGAGVASMSSPGTSAVALSAAPAPASAGQPTQALIPTSTAAPASPAVTAAARRTDAAARARAANEQRLSVPTKQSAATRARAVAVAKAPVASKPAPRAPDRASRSSRRSAWVTPLEGRRTSGYGPRWGRQHGGVDVAAAAGVPIRAAAAGQVVVAGWGGGYGNLVRLRHANGTVTAYAHMSRILVQGSSVRAGEVIGEVGSTGRSTGPHLHFEVRTDDRPLNPINYLRAKGVDL